jgi:uncharacterized protein YjhX (UPF0386 family)
MKAAFVLLTLLSLPLPLHAAQEADAPAAVSATVAPAEAREVVAEGRAAIGEGGVIPARKAAEAQALRNAVEKATGVYVGARTLTQNYALVRDQVVTRSAGFATLKQVVREVVGPQEVRVTVRALVSLRPLAEQLKALNLTRAWRVYVKPAGDGGSPGAHARAGQTTLEQALASAGFVVVSAPGEADVTVRVKPAFTTVADTPLETAAGPMTMHSVRGEVSVRATRAQTGEVIAALSASDTALHISVPTARSQAAEAAMKTLAPRLTDALLLLPARDAQPVELVVSNLLRVGDVERLEDALNRMTGVRGVTRRGWQNGRATWELEVFTEAQPMLARLLETSADTRPFRLNVASETRARITAFVTPPARPTAAAAKGRRG